MGRTICTSAAHFGRCRSACVVVSVGSAPYPRSSSTISSRSHLWSAACIKAVDPSHPSYTVRVAVRAGVQGLANGRTYVVLVFPIDSVGHLRISVALQERLEFRLFVVIRWIN